MGGIIGSVIGAQGGDSATSDQINGLNNANQLEQQLLTYIQGNEAPYAQAGTGAINNLSQLLGTTANNGTATAATGGTYGSLTQPFTLQDFQQSPGYQFQLQQGQQATNYANSASGISPFSGAGVKSIDAYTQGLANQEYQQAYNNYNTNQNNLYNRLMGVTGVGTGANNALNSAATNSYGAQAGIAQQIGNAYANNDINNANAWSTGLTSVFNNGAQYLGGSAAGQLNNQTQGASSSVNWNQPVSDGSDSSGFGIASLIPMLAALF